MAQIYPKLNQYSHIVNKENIKAKSAYPANNNSLGQIVDLYLSKGQKVVVLDELYGANKEWCKVKLSSEQYGDIEVFIKSTDLDPVDKKIFLTPDNSSESDLDLDFPVIEWTTKEPYIPFIDKRNGTYCVVVETEYENILSVQHLDIMSKKAYNEGIQLLLNSKGYRLNNTILSEKINKYYSFGRVEEFYVDTRSCIPVKLLVTFPIRFLNKNNLEKGPKTQVAEGAKYEIKINSRLLEYKVDRLLSVFNYYSNDIQDYLTPNGVITGFVREYELIMIKRFMGTLMNLLYNGGIALDSRIDSDYTLGFNENFELQYAYQIKNKIKTVVEESVVNTYRFRSPFDTKRTINYFIYIDDIIREYTSLELQEFFNKYVKYPDAEFKKIDIERNGFSLTASEATKIKKDLDEAAKHCVAFSPQKLYQNSLQLANNVKAYQELSNPDVIDATARTRDTDSEEFEFWSTVGDSAKGNLVGSSLSLNQKSGTFLKSCRALMTLINKFNLGQWVLDYLTCTLKKGDVEIASTLTVDLIQVLNYLIIVSDSERNLDARDAEAILSFIQLQTCREKEQDTYLMILKALSAASVGAKGIKDIYNSVIKFKTPIAPNSTNLARNLTSAVVTAAMNLMVEWLKSLLQDILADACADDPNNLPLDAAGTRNPLNSSASNKGDGNDYAQNKQNLDKDRKNALKNSGVLGDKDPELYLDLLKALISDISCVLTPQEICSLVSGRAEPETIVMAKTIIRKKYLPELNELLQENQLKIFFKELGKNIDQSICEEIAQMPLANPSVPSLFCSPQQLAARKSLLSGKLPEDLLNEQLKNYNKRKAAQAQRAFDLLKNNFTKTLDLPFFCGDGQEGLVTPLNEWGRSAARQQIDSMYAPLYTTFNAESTDWPSVVTFIRKEQEDGITKDINEVSYNLRKNLEDDSSFSILENNYSLTVKNKLINEEDVKKIEAVSDDSLGGPEAKTELIERIKQTINAEYMRIEYNGNEVIVTNSQTGEFKKYKFNENLDLSTSIEKTIEEFEKNKTKTDKTYENFIIGFPALSSMLSIFSDSYDSEWESIEKDEIDLTRKINKEDIRKLLINNIDRNTSIRQNILNAKYFAKDMKYASTKYLNIGDDPEDLRLKDYKKKTVYWDIIRVRKRGPWKLISFQDGTPYLNSFKLSRDPTEKELACGIDTHYLNLSNLKKKIMQEYEDNICDDPTGPQDNGREKLSAFEKANLQNALNLIFRIYLADYLLKSLPIFIKNSIKEIIKDKFFIDFYKEQMIADLKEYDYELYERFDKYLKELHQENIENDRLDNRFIDKDPYIYFFKKEINYASNKFDRALRQYSLSGGSGLNLEVRDYEQDINNLKIYVEEFIQLRESDDRYTNPGTIGTLIFTLEAIIVGLTVATLLTVTVIGVASIIAVVTYEKFLKKYIGKKEYLNIPYSAYDDAAGLTFFTFKNNIEVFAGARIVSRDGSKKVILAEELKYTGYKFDEFFDSDISDPKEIEKTRKEVRSYIMDNPLIKASADFLYSDGIFVKLMVPYCFYSSKMLSTESTAFLGSKVGILSILNAITGDKDPFKDEAISSQTDIDRAVDILIKSKNPSILLSQNPELGKFGAKEIISTLLKTPLDVVRSWAEIAEPNIAISKITSDAVHLASSIGWIFVKEEVKEKLYRKSAYPYKFFRDGEPVLRTFMVSPFLLPFIFPLTLAYGVYIGLDIYEFSAYLAKISGETSTEDQKTDNQPQTINVVGCTDEEREKLQMISEGEV